MSQLVFDMEPSFLPLYERCKSETMTSVERTYALWSAVRHLVRVGIAGDVVECGVWRGGSMMLAALTLAEEGDLSRRLWLYDTFDGMTAPTGPDIQTISGRPASAVLAEAPRTADDPFWAIAPRDVVERNMRATGYPEDRLVYVPGRVEDTLPGLRPERIALLRLDTDWYESTLHELVTLWPALVEGGILIIDDYGYWQGAKRAVDEFFSGASRPPFLMRIDYTGRLLVKQGS